MARPGFVLEIDERTPPLVVPDGDGFRLERFPLGTRVVYPADALPPVPSVTEAISAALDAPLGSEPLASRLHPGMTLTLAFDDLSTPVPRMHRPDVRGRILEAVLTRAARAGVDDVEVVCARGLNRRLTEAELLHLVGERVFRSFFADGRLTHHDAEDADRLTTVGSTELGETRVNASAARSDLLVFVHVATAPGDGGVRAVARGLGSTSVIGALTPSPSAPDVAAEVLGQIDAAVPVFAVEAVLDNALFAAPWDFLGKREWEWRVQDRALSGGLRRGLGLVSHKTRRRVLNSAQAGYGVLRITGGDPAPVAEASRQQLLAQQLVEVPAQADVGIVGVPDTTPFSVGSTTNPVLAAWQGLSATFGAHTGRPVVRPGGALILYHPMRPDFSGLHHPSFVDFFADVLPTTTDPAQIAEKFEATFAGDAWYSHLYRTSFAFHGVLPFHLWYELSAVRAHCGDVIWVGADRPSVDRLGFRTASTLADALEIVSSTVGRSPSITYLHHPPALVADVR